MAGDGSKKSVLAAIAGNSIICVVKFIGYGVTGSGALLSEAIHTAADLMNQWLLFLGIAKSARNPDPRFPFGYARERFVWALISAVGIFFLGCGVTLYHGVQSLFDTEHSVTSPAWAIGILLFSFALEGVVLWVAARELSKAAKAHQTPFFDYCRKYADPSAVAVLLEDSAACLGVLIALVALGLNAWTGSPVWDGIGSILIGLLLGAVAIWLIQRNRTLLVGMAIPESKQDAVLEIVRNHPAVEEVVEIKTHMMGSGSYHLHLAVDFSGKYLAEKVLENDPEAMAAGPLDFGEAILNQTAIETEDLESQLRSRIPEAEVIEVEGRRGRGERRQA